jgi:NLR family CARD domain-containing protein 3
MDINATQCASVSNDATALALNEKFLSDESNFVLSYGNKQAFMAGLEKFIGRPHNPDILAGMETEHVKHKDWHFSPPNQNNAFTTTPFLEWTFVMESHTDPNKISSNGLPRRIVSIDELERHVSAKEADLTQAEIVAARLYTGPMYMLYNAVLRDPEGVLHRERFIYTIHAISSCIVKLSKIHTISTLYRGVKGGALPSCFLNADEHGARGGIEFGILSTSTDKSVAMHYATTSRTDEAASKDTAASLVFEIEEGMIDRGADISWLSQVSQHIRGDLFILSLRALICIFTLSRYLFYTLNSSLKRMKSCFLR